MNRLNYLPNAWLGLWHVIARTLQVCKKFCKVTLLPTIGQWALNRLCTLVHFGHDWVGMRGPTGMDHCMRRQCTASTFFSERVIMNDGYSGLVQLVPGDFMIGPKWLNALVELIERIWPPEPAKDMATQIEVVPAPRAELDDAHDQVPAGAQHSYA